MSSRMSWVRKVSIRPTSDIANAVGNTRPKVARLNGTFPSANEPKGIVNIGYRPTFEKKKLILEAHIFGLKKNLYDKKIKIMLIKFIRNEKKFRNILELKKQIAKDIKIVKQI